ncbi:hypothetical protein TNCV_1147521 [Trichonephila clavipes]|nr:hypothetical protein TNCV_1147521 [Trichonephila clavipes]
MESRQKRCIPSFDLCEEKPSGEPIRLWMSEKRGVTSNSPRLVSTAVSTQSVRAESERKTYLSSRFAPGRQMKRGVAKCHP